MRDVGRVRSSRNDDSEVKFAAGVTTGIFESPSVITFETYDGHCPSVEAYLFKWSCVICDLYFSSYKATIQYKQYT